MALYVVAVEALSFPTPAFRVEGFRGLGFGGLGFRVFRVQGYCQY